MKSDTGRFDGSEAAGLPGRLKLDVFRDLLRGPRESGPPIDQQCVLAALVDGKNSMAAVQKFHELSHINSPAGRDEPIFEGMERTLVQHDRQLQDHIADLQKIAARTDPYIEIPGPEGGTPWTAFDSIKVGALSTVSIALLVVGQLSVSQILLASGVPGFEQSFRAYLFSIVTLAASFVLKNMANQFSPGPPRRRFAQLVAVIGLSLAVGWTWLFVNTFPGMLSSPVLLVDKLMLGTTLSPGSEATGQYLLLIGLLGEIFLAAACFIEIERLIDSHNLSQRVSNPRHAVVMAHIDDYVNQLAETRLVAGEARARLGAIRAAREIFVTKALTAVKLLRAGVAAHGVLVQPERHMPGDNHSNCNLHNRQTILDI